MTISTQELFDAIEVKNGFPLDLPQRNAIIHGTGPLWIIAGPGTGKTEVIVLRCIKLVCCDDIQPGSILVTTFTEKAAKNLEDRINDVMAYFVDQFPQLFDIDLSQLRIGTLHSLCNDILQEYRYVPYQNLRLLDSVESQMLIRQQIANTIRDRQQYIYNNFRYLFDNKPNPNLWDWTKALQTIFDRLIDYRIDINSLRRQGLQWLEISEALDLYEDKLTTKYSCDFGHLLKYFLEFLNSPQSQTFLHGDETRPPLLHILVDEYQDTNPIQEEIYLKLAGNAEHNLTVVGDDDQALYRFRGGTIECMVGFGQQCMNRWGLQSNRITLVDNHRSDRKIVDWCNQYVTSFPIMMQNGVRVQEKPPIVCSSGRDGNYNAVGLLRSNNAQALADSFAETVSGLLANGIISDYNQCALLLRSTKDSPRNAGTYIQALHRQGIPIYNPRSKAFLDQIEVQELLGTLISILDYNSDYLNGIRQTGVVSLVENWINAYTQMSVNYPALETYVRDSITRLQNAGLNERITSAMPTIIYRILSFEPFVSYQNNQEQDLRLSKITRIFEAFCSQNGRELYMDDTNPGRLSARWMNAFYYVLCGYLEVWGMDDDEDDEVVCPTGMLPIMTIHQSKGLQFDFVFVGSLGQNVSVGSSHKLEENLRPYRISNPIITHSAADSSWHDEIRLHYVAYSRAKYALILMAHNSQLRKTGTQTASFGPNGGTGLQRSLIRL